MTEPEAEAVQTDPPAPDTAAETADEAAAAAPEGDGEAAAV